ncbi:MULTISPECIES: multiheme c-type cytochrome [Rhodopirellula]|jgi:predicted CXXCH cytochrome family protein|uniref:multiheme c-type cytochrome n=1 Tax=Rhodopirellula TaxID=265488 RepID=UPI000344FBDA|nr:MULTISPECIES: multiheme c-type cytochrome [Rhodopirellula]MCR9206655.1 cytochrome C [bacterium]
MRFELIVVAKLNIRVIGMGVAGLVVASATLISSNEPGIGTFDLQHPEVSLTQFGDAKRSDQTGADAKFVGRKVCRECHETNFDLHANHGHASTFHQVSQTDLPEIFADTKFDGGANHGIYEYFADDQQALYVRLPAEFGQQAFPLQYALGSGQHAQTMLTLTTSADGQTEGIEHRVTCYHNERVGITPGHSKKIPSNALELFGDMQRGEPLQRCVDCHTTQGEVVDASVKGLVANVNCEKCHGPGSEHVRVARNTPTPPKYSVGREDWDGESEIQLCGDCHRLPKNLSEREVREYPDLLARFQPVGMLRSRCYLESNGQMRCTTCHNPHQTIQAVAKDQHIHACIQCHDNQNTEHVVCSVSTDSGCIGCHMPPLEMDEGLRFHDHWIRVREE